MYKNSTDLYMDLINNYIILSPHSDKFVMMDGGNVYRWDSCFKFKPRFPFSNTGKWIGKWVNTTINLRDFSEMCWSNCVRGDNFNHRMTKKDLFNRGD